MKIIEAAPPQASPIPGIAHATLACHLDGLTQLSVWRQSLAPGAATPPHRHDCDEVVLCLSGRGEVHEDGRVLRFASGDTVALPAGRDHQLFSTGPQSLELVGIFAATPVMTRTPDGEAMVLPWQS